LIELIIVIAILGLVLTAAFSMFGFVNKVLIKGEDQASVQQGVRMASMYISNEVRTAKDVTILDALPDAASMGLYNYIYVDGSTIKHRNVDGSETVDIMKLGIGELQPSLVFNAATNNTLLEFNVDAVLKDQNFTVTSEITPLNLVSGDKIQIDPSLASTGGDVLRYSDPIADDDAIIRIDTLLLDLLKLNGFLNLDGEFLVIEPPTIDPNLISLPTKGTLGSIISWASSSTYITTNGVVFRPLSSGLNQEVTLTATISKGSGTPATKVFKVRVMKLEPLVFDALTMSISVVAGEEITHQILAKGGNPGYTFAATGMPVGLTLGEYGLLTGSVSGPASFSVTVSDSHIDMATGLLTPNNQGPSTFNITITP